MTIVADKPDTGFQGRRVRIERRDAERLPFRVPVRHELRSWDEMSLLERLSDGAEH